ncbi:Bug family tripartite tricarboxylate transporter substrate binding protein [Pseudoroseomonas wenyumeiae]
MRHPQSGIRRIWRTSCSSSAPERVRGDPIPQRGRGTARPCRQGDGLGHHLTLLRHAVHPGRKVKTLAVAEKEPIAALPGVPTIAATLPDFEATTWHGIAGPAGMAPDLSVRIAGVFNGIIARPEVRENLVRTQGAEFVGGTPADFAAFIRREADRWIPIIRSANIRAE